MPKAAIGNGAGIYAASRLTTGRIRLETHSSLLCARETPKEVGFSFCAKSALARAWAGQIVGFRNPAQGWDVGWRRTSRYTYRRGTRRARARLVTNWRPE
jgi:hypothetical protein